MARKSALVVTCEHASNAVPSGVSLGVDADVLASHVAWDPGAIEAARRLSERFRAPLFAGEVSRLVVDLNRSPNRAVCVPERAFGVEVPGNVDLDHAERTARIARWHRPFRAIVSGAARSIVGRGMRCMHLSVHTFTPTMNGQGRIYAAGILFDPSRPWELELADRMLAALAEAGIDARPNLPYPGTDDGTTTWLRTHFPADRYAGIELELSQGLSAAERSAIVERIGDVVASELADSDG